MKTTRLQPIIGLEIHVQLKTKSKMFCGCDNSDGNPPNTTICPVCLAHPGTLPVANRQAIEWAIRAAEALNCRIPEASKFDRKNYFYPDLPKGYQISQYDQPIGVDGWLEFTDDAGVRHRVGIRRIHLEEDAAKNLHSADGRHTLVDFNRAGTPLMEIVTEPDLHSPQHAKIFLQELRLIMRYLNISDADMEKGHLRCDANVNLWELDGRQERVAATPIVEVKNINSFRSLERALTYELERQRRHYEETSVTIEHAPKSTRGWDDAAEQTVEQRIKEEAHDYRYFPEPDLPPLDFAARAPASFNLEQLAATVPELPIARRRRFTDEYGLSNADAKILTDDRPLADYFEQVMSEVAAWEDALPQHSDAEERKDARRATKLVANWLIHKLGALLNADKTSIRDCPITPENFAELISQLAHAKINSTLGQRVLEQMYRTGGDPTDIIAAGGLHETANTVALEELITHAIAAHPDAVASYRKGKTNAIMFMVGQVMKAVHGKANPEKVKAELAKRLQAR